jgi:hypothetical protein
MIGAKQYTPLNKHVFLLQVLIIWLKLTDWRISAMLRQKGLPDAVLRVVAQIPVVQFA